MHINIPTHPQVLFWLGVLGIVFYAAIAPIIFPGVPQLRQPELLPVYTLMIGLGQLTKGSEAVEKKRRLPSIKISLGEHKEDDTDEEN